MTQKIRTKMNTVKLLACGDDCYYHMLKECREMEPQYCGVLESLPSRQRDIIQDYLMLCESMSWRMLEIACLNMEFPDERK